MGSACSALLACAALAIFADAAVAQADGAAGMRQRNQLIDLVEREGAAATPKLIDSFDNDQPSVRYTAAHLLARLGEPAREALARGLTHDDAHIRYIALNALAEINAVQHHIQTLVTDPDVSIRLRFYEQIMPRHFLNDGAPSDVLIERLDAAYDDARPRVRTEIVNAVAALPLTDASIAFLRQVADKEKARVAAEGSEQEPDISQKRALTALRPLLQRRIERMRALAQAGEWQKLIDRITDADIASWPETDGRGRAVPRGMYASEPVEALYLLAKAYYELGQGEKAEATLRRIVGDDRLGISHFRERYFYSAVLDLYRDNYRQHLADDAQVRQRYVEMALTYGDRLAGRRDDEARASYERALELDGLGTSLKEKVTDAIDALDDPDDP